MHVTLKMLMYVLIEREYHKSLKKKSENNAEKIYIKLKEISEKSDEYINLSNERNKLLADKINHDNQQLLLKKLANSWFGSLGCPSVNPWGDLEAAEKTTCIGRMLLRIMIYYLKNIGYDPIVGDSFTGDTPLFIKYDDTNFIDIKPIEELIGKTETDALGREYDTSEKPYSVLCRSGWVKPNYIYRHKTNKQIYRVNDGKTIVDITEDHSLFNDNKEKIKPSEINGNTKLEYYTDKIDHSFNDLSDNEIKIEAIMLKNGTIDRVPQNILNLSNKKSIKLFLKYIDGIVLNGKSKSCLAGISYLKSQIV